jgi:4-amino-4-deoxy-L-arabinose transferase-like glycosyltransferase
VTNIAVAGRMQMHVTLFRAVLRKVEQLKYFVPICFIAAFIVRVWWIYLVDAQPVSDSMWYYERAIDLAAGKGYSFGTTAYWPENLPPAALIPNDEFSTDRRPTAYWPVGYPAFLGLLLAVFGPSLLSAKMANIVLYLGIMLLSYLMARKLFNSELTGRMTVLTLAFYPNHIAYSSLLVTESLFLFLLLLGIALLLMAPKPRHWTAFASGVVLGLACLVKTQAILVPAIICAPWLAARGREKAWPRHLTLFIVVYLGLGLAVLPWAIRNYRVFNAFPVISNNGGINLLVGNNPYATGAYGGHQQIASMLSDVQDEYGRDVKARSLATRYGVEHPWETLKLWPSKLWYLYRKDVEGISWNENGMSFTEGGTGKTAMLILKAGAQFYYMLILIAFLFSLLMLVRERKDKTSRQPLLPAPVPAARGLHRHTDLGLWLVLYFTWVPLITFGDSRFHFPAMPWIVMYVASLAQRWIRADQPAASMTNRTVKSS